MTEISRPNNDKLRLTSPKSLELSSSELQFSFSPALGGSILGFAAKIDGALVPLMRVSPDDVKKSSDCASFLMLPYPNRIADASFEFEGQRYQLGNKEKHAIHGYVRDRPWKVIELSGGSATIEFDTARHPEIDYPFQFRATIRYELSDASLRTELTVENSGATRMPLGCGFHPYFRRALLVPDENVMLQYNVAGVYPTRGSLPLPSGEPVSLPREFDFSNPKSLEVELDHCFGGWDGKARMIWPKSKIELQMNADPTLGHLVAYSPPGKDFFALEPQSQMVDGFNFFAKGLANTGVVVLDPGQSWKTQFSLKLIRSAK